MRRVAAVVVVRVMVKWRVGRARRFEISKNSKPSGVRFRLRVLAGLNNDDVSD